MIPPSPLERSGWLVPAVLAILAALVQFAFIGRQGLWVDEVFSLAIATGHSLEHPANAARISSGDYVESAQARPATAYRAYLEADAPASIRRITRAVFLSDTNPPLYYILLHLWIQLVGTSDAALRLFSVAWSIACIPMIFAIGRHFGGFAVGVMAAILFIFSPLAVYYSTEGRMYSMLWFCVLAVALLSLRLHEGRGGFARQTLWVLGSAAGLLVHYFFVFPWLAICGFHLLSRGEERFRPIFGRIVAVVLLVFPWYWQVPASLQNWRVTQDWLNVRPSGFHWLDNCRDLAAQFLLGRGQDLWRLHRKVELVELALFLVLAGAVLWRLRHRVSPGRTMLIWAWVGAALLGPVVFDLLRGTYTAAFPRYALAALPGTCLLVGLGLGLLPKSMRLAILAGIVLGWGVSLRSIYRNEGRLSQPIREAAKFVNVTVQPSDLVLVQSIPSGVLGFARYATFNNPIASWVEQLGVRTVPDSARALVGGHQRVIFVKFHLVRADAPAEAWLRTHSSEEQANTFGSITVTAFRLKPPEP